MALDGQTGSKKPKRGPEDSWDHVLRSLAGLLWPSGPNAAAPVPPENLLIPRGSNGIRGL